ncbi:MAG: AAA domain-containing protein [Candidatus Dadabacteria bacterium]|nr:AAA domain-containing protein [Candidatus Dadabacteria bacterium]
MDTVTGNFWHLYKLVVNKTTKKVELNTWFANRNNAKKAAEAEGMKDFTVCNSDKAVKLKYITEKKVKEIISKPCNYGRGVSKRQYDSIVTGGRYGKLSKKEQALLRPIDFSSEENFPWIRFYESIAEKLLDFRDKRDVLVGKIHEIAEQVPALSGLQDKFKDGTTGPLKDICPFTTTGIFNQGHTFENRKIIAIKLANSLDVSEQVPASFDGIPVVSSQNAWFFSYDKDRHRDDIDTLWEVFDQALKLAESDEMDNRSAFISAYDKAIQCRGVGWNLTMGLYWIHPLSFPTLDRRSRDYIEEELGIKIPKKYSDVTATEYLQIRDTLRSRFLEDECPVNSFPDLSLTAWLSGSEHPPGPKKDETEDTTNLIFHGPPGTGKTYELNRMKQEYSGGPTLNRKAWLMGELLDTPWFKVIFATLHDLGQKAKVSEISEHEYVRAKAESVGRVKHVKNTIWAVLQAHAPEDAEFVKFKNKGQHPAVFDKNENSFWLLVNDWEEECKDIVELSRRWKDGPDQKSANERFEFVTFHQAYSYEDFIEGLRPVQDEESGDIKYEIIPGVFRRICSRAKADPEQRYAIFIDEINRGNIASVFGELITLIETDKRVIHGEDGSTESGMTLTLPYSGERFGVPANLDVYGTMNTADRSIALLDTALRRRFQFREMMPDTSVIKGSSGNGLIEDGKGGTIDLRRLIETINRRIRFLLGRDMTIGHSYFINVRDFDGLKNALYSRIIPLLQEYFYDDWHRIQLVFRDVGANGEKLEPQIIRHMEIKEEEILGFDHDDFEDSIEYSVASEDEITPDAIRKVYEEKTTPDA